MELLMKHLVPLKTSNDGKINTNKQTNIKQT